MKDYEKTINSAKNIISKDDHKKYLSQNSNEETIITEYQVFPGIKLIYNDIHVEQYTLGSYVQGNYIEINHCREGRMEREFKDEFFYLMPGDISIIRKTESDNKSYFPLSHYHGITILIDINSTPKCLSHFLNDVNVNPSIIAEKFCSNDNKYFIARSKRCIEHIFSELYAVPDSIRKGYFKVKILELLLILSNYEPTKNKMGNRCLSRKQVSLAKKVCKYLMSNIDKHITISEVSDTFNVSPTALKTAFKGVYGVPIYSYLRIHRMQTAALLLRRTNQSVMEIANTCGYDNASKFSGAFRAIMGLTPNEYRNINTYNL